MIGPHKVHLVGGPYSGSEIVLSDGLPFKVARPKHRIVRASLDEFARMDPDVSVDVGTYEMAGRVRCFDGDVDIYTWHGWDFER